MFTAANADTAFFGGFPNLLHQSGQNKSQRDVSCYAQKYMSHPKNCRRLCFSCVSINPIWPGLFWCIKDQGAGAHCIVPPLNIFGLGRVRIPILFGNYFPRSDLPYTKGFMKFGCPEPSKKVFDFWNFCSSKCRLTRFIRVPPYEILVFPTNFIFFQGNEITSWGKKCTALFQTHNWEKSSFFNELVRVFAQKYAST